MLCPTVPSSATTSVRTSGDSETVPLAVWWGSGIGTRTARTLSCLMRGVIELRLPPSGGRLRTVILFSLLLQKLGRARDLLETIHAVLDRDPAAIAHTGEDAEDRVVVVHAFAGDAVLQR